MMNQFFDYLSDNRGTIQDTLESDWETIPFMGESRNRMTLNWQEHISSCRRDAKVLYRRVVPKERECIGNTAHDMHQVVQGVRTMAAQQCGTEWAHHANVSIGPTITFFVEWLIERFLNENLDVVFVDCSESNLLAKMLQRAVLSRNLSIEVVELETTYAFTFLASIASLKPADIRLRQDLETIGDLFDLFGVPKSAPQLAKTVTQPTSNSEVMGAIERFFMSDNVRTHIEENCKTNRHILMQNVAPLLEGRRVVGFVGFCADSEMQHHMTTVFDLSGAKTDMHGFYMWDATTCHTDPSENRCKAYLGRLLAGDASDDHYRESIHRQQKMFSVALARSNEHYEDVLESAGEYQRWWYAAGLPFAQNKLGNDLEALSVEVACAVLYRLMLAPTRNELRAFGTLSYCPFRVGGSARTVLVPSSSLELLNGTYSDVCLNLEHSWPAGVVAIVSPGLLKMLWRAPDGRDQLDKLLNDDVETAKHLNLKTIDARQIHHVDVAVGGWTSYSFELSCPFCGESIQCEAAGTIIICKYLCCPHCTHLSMLGYDALVEHLGQTYSVQQSESLQGHAGRLVHVSSKVNHALRDATDAPLLAALSNEYFMALLSKGILNYYLEERQ